ncbi:MAG: hypothetical protein GX595_05825 [Lentisphaerae bacterium]|nr:hypothetical protein [Lentisphaerota bacterium]
MSGRAAVDIDTRDVCRRGVAWPRRHNAGDVVTFVDGHVECWAYDRAIADRVFWNHP